jgi:hypothetical protein
MAKMRRREARKKKRAAASLDGRKKPSDAVPVIGQQDGKDQNESAG